MGMDRDRESWALFHMVSEKKKIEFIVLVADSKPNKE
jgi:hypothetical protein